MRARLLVVLAAGSLALAAVSLVLAAVSLAPGRARADVIGEPPMCPPLSEPVFCHGPPTCSPRQCLSSRECASGEHCAIANLCVEQHGCGGGGDPDPRTHVFGPCGAGERCEEGTCSGLFVCLAGSSEDASVPRDASGIDASETDAGDGRTHVRYGCDCHCSVGAARGHASSPWLALALPASIAGVVLARRRRRASRY